MHCEDTEAASLLQRHAQQRQQLHGRGQQQAKAAHLAFQGLNQQSDWALAHSTLVCKPFGPVCQPALQQPALFSSTMTGQPACAVKVADLIDGGLLYGKAEAEAKNGLVGLRLDVPATSCRRSLQSC